MIYNEKLKQFIPLNWDSCTLNELCDMYQPQTLSEDNLIDDGEFFVYGANGIIGRRTWGNTLSQICQCF